MRPSMPDEMNLVARSLILTYGDLAVAVAERAAENVRSSNMAEKVEIWARVVEAIKAIQRAES
jgi:hypothetical protein